MTDHCRVAVLMAVYNGTKYMDEQISSILGQSGVSVTVYVSVDLSDDESYARVLEWSSRDVRVVPLSYGERFGGAGPNFFRLFKDVNFDNYDAVSLSDQDDCWFPGKLERSLSCLKNFSCDVYSSNVTAFWPDGRRLLVDKAQQQKKFDHFFEAAGPGCTYVFSRSSAIALKTFIVEVSDRLSSVSLHDWLAYAFCRSRGYRWYIDPCPSMLYRQHSDNQVGTNTGLQAIVKRLNMVRAHWYRKQVSQIVELVSPELSSRIDSYFFRLLNFYRMRRRSRDAFILLLLFIFGVY